MDAIKALGPVLLLAAIVSLVSGPVVQADAKKETTVVGTVYVIDLGEDKSQVLELDTASDRGTTTYVLEAGDSVRNKLAKLEGRLIVVTGVLKGDSLKVATFAEATEVTGTVRVKRGEAGKVESISLLVETRGVDKTYNIESDAKGKALAQALDGATATVQGTVSEKKGATWLKVCAFSRVEDPADEADEDSEDEGPDDEADEN
ncbi:hypothetical protein ACFL59_11375 [Planctomycetota bacterium]